ncbi:MAG: hypothetical protein IKA26_01625 [Alistipes sp.]|nr:hypothetical protein [Alistipes sp.]
MRGLRGIILAAVMVAFSACLAPQSAHMTGVDARSWRRAESITYINNDTLSLRDMNIVLRHNSDLKQNTLPLKIAITTPDARYFEEIREVKLQQSKTAFTVAATNSIPYRTNVLLSQRGCYIISFEPLSEVRGVEAIGVEFSDNKD